MRKVSREEAAGFVIQKGQSTAVRTAVMHLNRGEILLIERKDWKPKDSPGQMISRLSKRTGMEFKLNKIVNGGGWIVERLK